MPVIINHEAENEIELSKYPFADTADPDSTFPLTEVILDLRVYAFGLSAPAYLSSLRVGADATIFTFSDAAGTSTAAGIYTYGGDTLVRCVDAAGRPAGVIDLTDEATTIPGWGVGDYTFDAAATELVASVVTPVANPGVSGLRTPDGKIFYGNVHIFGEQGVMLRESEDGAVRVDLVGDPAAEARYCVTDNVTVRRPVQTINGVFGDSSGDYAIISGTGETETSLLRIMPISGGLLFKASGK